MRLEWTDPALDALEGIRDYIAKDSPYYARRFTEQVVASVEKLAEFPKIGRPVPEAKGREDVRCWIGDTAEQKCKKFWTLPCWTLSS